MKKRYHPFMLPPWIRKFRAICVQVLTPIIIFQLIRTLLIPTTFDILLLGVLIGLAVALRLNYI